MVPTTVDIFKPKGFTKRKKNKALGLSETRRTRKPVKFGAIDGLSSGSDLSDSESEFDELKAKAKALWTSSSHSSSTHTLVDERIGKDALTGPKSLDHVDLDNKLKIRKEHPFQKDPIDTLGYPDYEDEDLSTVHYGGYRIHNTVAAARTEGQDWHPGFLKRHTAVGGVDHSSSAKPVPATPSLTKVMDRIAVAQRDAFGSPPPGNVVSELPVINLNTAGSPKRGREIKSGDEKAPRWEDFWKEVRVKAQARS